MVSRRNFINQSVLVSAGAVVSSVMGNAVVAEAGEVEHITIPAPKLYEDKFRPKNNFGLGGVAIGNGFSVSTNEQSNETLSAAWAAGVRYFDTSPWYGLGISERRFGHFLTTQKREDFVLSTKVGRILNADKNFTLEKGIWKGQLNFNYKYDYTAAGVRRSVEDSLQRLGLSYLDVVFIHDLSPDNEDMKDKWTEYFEIAAKGAMPELTKMREEGIIKGWGLGVNTIEPILKTIDVADPDIFLSATQYSLIKHEDALNKLFPVCEKRDISLVIGAPLNAGFLAGLDRYDYNGTFPAGVKEKRSKIETVCKKFDVDLRTAALQFSAAPSVVSSVIPGARRGEHAKQNAASMNAQIPAAFWKELKLQKLIAEHAPEPRIK